jgi:hypothetical protein
MTSISEIKDRLDAVAFAGRSYPGATRSDLESAYRKALEDITEHAVGDLEFLVRRLGELRAAITVAAMDLADAAGDIAANYAANDEEVAEIRLSIGEPMEKLIAVAQGTSVQPEEGAK